MSKMNRRQWMTTVAALGLGGCARFAVRPPTPAASMNVKGLWDPRPDEKFYVLVFGSQSTPKIARLTHTWAVFVRVQQHCEAPAAGIDYHVISWLPTTLEVHPWYFRVEQGYNLRLDETFQTVLKNNERISEWGPYECRPHLYYRSLVQKDFLESGQIGYQAVDVVGEAARKGNGCDCIHSITDMDPLFNRNHYPLRRFGEVASQFLVKQVWERDILIHPEQTHDWLNEALGLDRYPIIHRCYKGRVNERLARKTREEAT
jgi:hypothetical protein